MFGVSAIPFFDISTPVYGKDDKKIKYLMGMYRHNSYL